MPARSAIRTIALTTVFLTGLFGGLVIGVVAITVLDMTREPEPGLWEISSELREEADPMFADYKAGRVLYTTMLPVLGTRIKVRVVNNRYRGADYGFVPLDEVGDAPVHFWFMASGFELKKYDDEHLFVILKDHYVNEIVRDPDESRYTPTLPDEVEE